MHIFLSATVLNIHCIIYCWMVCISKQLVLQDKKTRPKLCDYSLNGIRGLADGLPSSSDTAQQSEPPFTQNRKPGRAPCTGKSCVGTNQTLRFVWLEEDSRGNLSNQFGNSNPLFY